MTALLLGQILGVSFACGLNLYLTVAALGILSRFDIVAELPTGLQGLEGAIVIGSALALYLIEAVVDKIRHADSLWDTVHTFIRPPAAALLAAGALWGHPLPVLLAASAIGFIVALAAHGTKAGVRLALNASLRSGQPWLSALEDVLAIAFATGALLRPWNTLVATGLVLLIVLLVGPRFWRAFQLGLRGLVAWLRAVFSPARWRDQHELPRHVTTLLDDTPLGAAPPRGSRAALHGAAGAYRNGWLVTTSRGPVFVYRTLFGTRRFDLPRPRDLEVDPGVWADVIRVRTHDDGGYTLFMLKDGPTPDDTTRHLSQAAP